MSSAATSALGNGAMPPVLGRLMRGTFWLALKTPIQVIIAFWSIPLTQKYLGPHVNGALVYAWGFSFLQFLFEFGMSSALQRQVSDCWTRGDREGVDQAVACGMNFYAAMTAAQFAALLGVAYWGLPRTAFVGEEYALAFKLLWLQAVTAPCFGVSVIVHSVLQAARRYEFVPRLETVVIVLRFLVLIGGISLRADYFLIAATQTFLQVALLLGPAIWVMLKELDYRPRFRLVALREYRTFVYISFYMFLIQLSVVLADKIDTTILGSVLDEPGPAESIYQYVSKPFSQIRQTGWTLSYLVMPAVASLVAARDYRGLERVKYDGPRYLIGLLLPVSLLAGIYAAPFLSLWMGPSAADSAPLLQLFLVAVIPQAISVQVQAAIGMGKISVIAVSALVGAMINLPLSYFLTIKLGVAGVIWGTVLTTLFSNLLVPGIYVFKVLEIRLRYFLTRTLGAPLAGGLALISASLCLGLALDPMPSGSSVTSLYGPFLIHLATGSAAYVAGYLSVPTGRADLRELLRKLDRRAPRLASDAASSN